MIDKLLQELKNTKLNDTKKIERILQELKKEGLEV